MRRRIAWLAGTVAACYLAAPAMAQAESLRLSLGASETLGKPLNITASGVADGAHRLFAYADRSPYVCASDPFAEYNRSTAVALSSTSGEPLSAGTYSMPYVYTWVDPLRICAYLDDTPSDVPDVSANASPPQDPVNEYLEKQEQAQPTRSWTGTFPGAIQPAPVNPQVQREYWERVAREAQSKQEREHAEHEVQKALKDIAAHCVVPSLKGDSLGSARQVLLHAHCKLGKVSRDRGVHGPLVVTRQTPARGKKLRQGAAVAVTLGSPKR